MGGMHGFIPNTFKNLPNKGEPGCHFGVLSVLAVCLSARHQAGQAH